MRSTGAQQTTVEHILGSLLKPPHPAMLVFWLDDAGHFRSVWGRVNDGTPEMLDIASAFKMRLGATVSPSTEVRLYYVADRAVLDPIAELVQCFGHAVTLSVGDVMRGQGWEPSPAAMNVERNFGSAYLYYADRIPQQAHSHGRMEAGLVAAALNTTSIELPDLAAAYLRRLGEGTSRPSFASQSDPVVEIRQLTQLVLGSNLEIDVGEAFDRDFFKRLAIAELSLIPGAKHLVQHLRGAGKDDLNRLLVERISPEAGSLRKLQSSFDEAIAGLGIDLDNLDLTSLLSFRLIAAASRVARDNIEQSLQSTAPDRVFDVLEGFWSIAASGSAMDDFSASLHFWHQLQKSRAELAAVGTAPEAFLAAYAGGWYDVDRSYRRAMVKATGTLANALQTHYRQWLRDQNVAFTTALQTASSWHFPRAQRTLGEGFIDASGGTAVLVCDALRYELATDVVASLGRDATVERDWAISSMPSITEVGMSALVPSRELLRLEVRNAQLRVFIGDRETTLKSARKGVWESAGFTVVELADVPLVAPDVAKLVVFHGAVDALGEKLQAESFAHFETLANELAQLVRALVKKQYTVHIVADHGFLTLPPVDRALSFAGNTSDDEVKKRRYRVTPDQPLEGAIISKTATELGFGGTAKVDFPPAVALFSAHGALTFLHGGISLQELVIPHFIVRPKSKKPRWDITAPKSIRARIVRVKAKRSHGVATAVDLELSAWRDGMPLAKKTTTVPAGTAEASISCELPEGVAPGQIRLVVGHPGQAVVFEESAAYEPDR